MALHAGRMPPVRTTMVAGAALVLTILLCGLGWWQVERLAWKLDLIERVNARTDAGPVPAPGPLEWAAITRDNAEYRRVHTAGRFLHDLETAVLAVTDHGRGYWIVTPLAADAGFVVLVNRGFVPAEYRPAGTRPQGQAAGKIEITGLLRISEPKGGFLRSNDPDAGHWYSRDVEQIVRARSLQNAAPYFIDADATPNPGGWPLGGMTRISFTNNHLVYALTWFGLALMTLAAGWYVLHDWRRTQAQPTDPPDGSRSSQAL